VSNAINYDRATFLRRTGVGMSSAAFVAQALAATAKTSAQEADSAPPMAASSPADALAQLKAGNARFVADKRQCGPVTARIAALASGQHPFAIVLGCSDSRVPVEDVFDQAPGNIFDVRVVGNFLTNEGLGSIEYSTTVLKSKLIVVLGHSSCGGVTAAVSYVRDGTTEPGAIQDLVHALVPAAQATKGVAGDWVANAVVENVRLALEALPTRSTIVADAVKGGTLQLVGGVYDLHTGSVAFL
jgi:carbonic anhydrase